MACRLHYIQHIYTAYIRISIQCMVSDILVNVSAALTVFGGALQVRVGLGVSGVIAQVEQAQGAVEAGHSVARTLTCIHINTNILHS